jgi:hypothetical protein
LNKKKLKKVNGITTEEEYFVTNITSIMILTLTSEEQHVDNKKQQLVHLIPLKRFLRKFRELHFEKCDRLVELFQKYLYKVVSSETLFLTEQQADEEDGKFTSTYLYISVLIFISDTLELRTFEFYF